MLDPNAHIDDSHKTYYGIFTSWWISLKSNGLPAKVAVAVEPDRHRQAAARHHLEALASLLATAYS
jgi:hypothetical protein